MQTQSAVTETDEMTILSPVDLLRSYAAAAPESAAVVSGAGTLDAGELWRTGSHLAGYLRDQGVVTDTCVGLYLEPSLELVQSVWGVLLAGAAYLPLSPDYPDDRISYMVSDSRAPVILTQAHLEARLRRLVPAGVEVITVESALAAPVSHSLDEVGGDDAAYVIYTSGSTGLPKGVVIEHHSIARQMRWIADSGTLPAGSRILQKTPFSFDAAQWEILASCIGSTVVIAAPGAYRDPVQILGAVQAHEVTALQCVPTLWSALCQTPGIARCASLRNLYSGGEVLSVQLAKRLRQLFPQASLINLYGPTETTINATSYQVTDEVRLAPAGAVPVGEPVTDTELFILDGELVPVSSRQTGELYIGGPQLARGYLHRDDLTRQRFIEWSSPAGECKRLYRTGDLAQWDEHQRVSFVGRIDDQLKINGYRIELDEVKIAVSEHAWIKEACVVPWRSERTGADGLAAFIELDPTEAALMDQGQHSAHHQSKSSRVQVRAQLAQLGVFSEAERAGRSSFRLPGKQATTEQAEHAFGRKTYRFFHGGPLHRDRLVAVLREALREPEAVGPASPDPAGSTPVGLTLPGLGRLLRWFGPFTSAERLLPKYAYASPGALSATRIYLEIGAIPGLANGLYYFHPIEHSLILVRAGGVATATLRLHLVGRRSAIRAVYSTNVDEVLHFEAGHMLGLLDRALPASGLGYDRISTTDRLPDECLDAGADDLLYLCGLDLHAAIGPASPLPQVEAMVQTHHDSVLGLPPGLYRLAEGELVAAGSEIVRRKDVIAINQQAYDRSSFGVALLADRELGWHGFLELGRALQRLQANRHAIGLMSSGYSSRTGRDLLSARRLDAITGTDSRYSYFAIGGPVSAEQILSRDMREDVVHMRGPAEILKDELKRFLPHYMLPSRIDIVESLPKTANGKCDIAALKQLARARDLARTVVPAETATEREVLATWSALLGSDDVSVEDDFFSAGGNSLLGVSLINGLNAQFGVRLPLQTIFEASTPRQLAATVDRDQDGPPAASRLISMSTGAEADPIFGWPGLGGFPMNLRGLGRALSDRHHFYGVQAHGINAGETPYNTIQQMAAADVELILDVDGAAPKTLVGYSFGARVAFEAAYQLEQAGHEVANLILVAPGSPRTARTPADPDDQTASFDNAYFVEILLSVFTGTVHDEELLAQCLAGVRDADSFTNFILERLDNLDRDLVRRVVRIVQDTFSFRYTFGELQQRTISAPITIIRAVGDDYSFIDGSAGFSDGAPASIALDHDHYSILRGPGLDQLVAAIETAINPSQRRQDPMPHINIKHFPLDLTEQDRTRLADELTATVSRVFNCETGVISIALEPVAQQDWGPKVYEPEIVNRSELLCKLPEYSMSTPAA